MPVGKRTALYEKHQALGAKMVEFGGWEMPVQYKGIIEEHHAVRTAAGLFDVSHMGELEVTGAGALDFLQTLLTNDVAAMVVGQALYSPMCYSSGGVVDDLLVYKLAEEKYWLVVNAGNKDKDWNWLKELYNREQQEAEQQKGKLNWQREVSLRDISGEIGQIALQGPLAEQILTKVVSPASLKELKYFRFIISEVAGIETLISRTGYTGEDGFELYFTAENTSVVWEQLLRVGEGLGLIPAGLGARDTLRFEACLPLYGHELDETITPLEAGLGFFVAWDKEDFVGKAALQKQKEEGVTRKLVGFVMQERGIPRTGYSLEKEGVCIGKVTSGSYAPTLGKNLGLGYISSSEAYEGNEISVIIRGKELKARIIKKPFYKKGRM
jgi:aminomethyltransferase